MTRITNSHGTGIALPNGTGVQVRTKAEDLLACLFTLNQGSGTLTTAQGLAAYVPFIDGNTLKIQNAANNAQITLGDVSLTNFGHANLAASNTFAAANIFAEDVTFDGATAGRDVVFDRSDNALEFADNAKATFGSSADLEIFHNTSDSIINDAGTGDLKLQLGGATKFQIASGGVALTGGAAANITALTSATTITIDMATACHHSVTLAHGATFAAPSNQVVGQSGSIFITQDGTGSRTGQFNTAFKFVGGTAPTLTTTAAAVDRIDYIILSSNVIHCAVSLDVKASS